jgi:hypothetical protein
MCYAHPNVVLFTNSRPLCTLLRRLLPSSQLLIVLCYNTRPLILIRGHVPVRRSLRIAAIRVVSECQAYVRGLPEVAQAGFQPLVNAMGEYQTALASTAGRNDVEDGLGRHHGDKKELPLYGRMWGVSILQQACPFRPHT